MTPVPKRLSATAFEVDPDLETAIADAVARESESAEVVSLVGLGWIDGRRTVAAAHIHFPPQDMSEADYQATIDEDALQQCDERHPDCTDSGDSCDEDVYEGCIRSAYRNDFVYLSAHLGVDCGVLEVSMYDVASGTPALIERRPLDAMACDWDMQMIRPAANDIDGDGGPELVYTWGTTKPDDWRTSTALENVAILDANTLMSQFAIALDGEDPEDDAEEVHRTASVQVLKRGGDGFFDLQLNAVRMNGFCPGYGWALDQRFVVTEDADVDDPQCALDITQTTYSYRPAVDTWEPQGSK